MIQEKTYTRDWVMGKSIEYMRGKRKADPTLIEKVTKAFHLLEELSKTNLKFVFKGGTSLLLLLSLIYSIDFSTITMELLETSPMETLESKELQKREASF